MSGFHRQSKRQKALKERELEIEAHWARGTNSKGLPVLADELLLEILSYFPPIPLPTATQTVSTHLRTYLVVKPCVHSLLHLAIFAVSSGHTYGSASKCVLGVRLVNLSLPTD